jgi:hypothetical protein
VSGNAGGTNNPGGAGAPAPAAVPGVEPLLPPQAHPNGEHFPAPEGAEEEGVAFRGLYFTGDYLLLRPRRDAFDYAISSPILTQTPAGTIQSVDWNTESGFRFGGGFRLPGQDWLVGVNYTNISSHGNDSVAAPVGGTLYATLTSGNSFDQVGTAVAATTFDFNVLDIELSRRVKVCDSFTMNFFGGGRFAWINQGLTATYNGGPDAATNDHVSSPVDFNGVGLTAGAEGQWSVWHGVGVYARARGSLLTGQFRDSFTETTNNGSVVIANVSEKVDQVVPVAELAMGVNYCSDHWHLSIGYEIQDWMNMVNSPEFPATGSFGKVQRRTSDLTLEGLAVQLGLAF